MNERIQELVKQAGINLTPAQFSGVLEDEVSEFDLEKFAELIVRECASLFPAEYDTIEGEITIGKIIKNHFGVKA